MKFNRRFCRPTVTTLVKRRIHDNEHNNDIKIFDMCELDIWLAWNLEDMKTLTYVILCEICD
jgi:hypothetical protein